MLAWTANIFHSIIFAGQWISCSPSESYLDTQSSFAISWGHRDSQRERESRENPLSRKLRADMLIHIRKPENSQQIFVVYYQLDPAVDYVNFVRRNCERINSSQSQQGILFTLQRVGYCALRVMFVDDFQWMRNVECFGSLGFASHKKKYFLNGIVSHRLFWRIILIKNEKRSSRAMRRNGLQ